jgi:hypothetical protein
MTKANVIIAFPIELEVVLPFQLYDEPVLTMHFAQVWTLLWAMLHISQHKAAFD